MKSHSLKQKVQFIHGGQQIPTPDIQTVSFCPTRNVSVCPFTHRQVNICTNTKTKKKKEPFPLESAPHFSYSLSANEVDMTRGDGDGRAALCKKL